MDFTTHWNDTLALWSGEPNIKKGESAHVIRASARKLVLAGLEGALDRIPSGRVLETIRKTQQRDGAMRGNFWWTWECGEVTDKNAAFFTTLWLLALRFEYYDALPAEARPTLDTLIDEAGVYFINHVFPVTPERLRYPNAYLGDVVCLWLIGELRGTLTDAFRDDIVRILAYYRDSPWGWGEHLSDIYAKVCQRELMALVLWARELPPEAERLVEELMADLVRIDGLYRGGPRVPTLRNYWMDVSPCTPETASDWFRPYTELMNDETDFYLVARLARRHGLEDRFVTPARPSESFEVDCFDGARALAAVTDRWRLGAMTRYPLMPGIDHPEWGLHWQCMPVALWHARGDWGYLQWAAEEDDTPRALPALVRTDRPSCVLSDREPDAAVGDTFSQRDGEGFIVYRRLPHVASTWPWAIDRFRLVNNTAAEPTVDKVGPWHRLVLSWGDGEDTLTVSYMPIAGDPEVALRRADEGELRFGATWRFGDERPAAVAGLWHIVVADGPADPPEVTDDGERLTIGSDRTEGAVTFEK